MGFRSNGISFYCAEANSGSDVVECDLKALLKSTHCDLDIPVGGGNLMVWSLPST